MKTKLVLAAAALSVVCSAVLGYRAGQSRPHIYWSSDGAIAFGWDSGNHCAAVWFHDTNGVPYGWQRLELERRPNAKETTEDGQ